jgi:hypothetical protein
MNTQQGLETLRTTLIENILQCLEGTLPKENLIELADSLNKAPEICTDLPLLECRTLLDFLSTQLTNENKDLVSPQFITEICTYMLGKLTTTPYIS